MNKLLVPSLLALAVAATGCSGESQPEATDQTQTQTQTAAADSSFDFQGDFSGPLGVQLYSFRREMQQDVPGTLARVRELGFREVELAGTYGMTPEQFRQELDRVGLRATSMHVSYERLRDSVQAVVREAKALGPQYVGVAWVPHEGEFTVETARQTAADFNRFGQALKEQGLQFFYHIHGYEFKPDANGVLPMDVLMQETDAEAVKYEMDVFWASRPGADPAALLRQHPDRWKLMHIKDMKKGTPTNDHSGQAPPDETEVPTGQGQIDYRAVLRAAEEIGLERYYIEDETSDPFGSIAQSIQFLQTVQY